MHLFRRHSAEYKIIAKSKYFNRKWYLSTYQDVKKAKMDPIEHYLKYGWKEGRNPSPYFNNDLYLSKYEKDVDFEICPLIHYEKYGKNSKLCRLIGSVNQPNSEIKNFTTNNKLLLPTFSIIVATYNRANILIKTLYSILAQTYQNFEIIIIDDGSTDNTKDLIHEHFLPEIKSKKIRYFYKKNNGVCSARNYGLKRAKNTWIAYVDSDNLLFPTFLNVFVQNILENKKQKTFYCAAYTFNGNALGRDFDYNHLMVFNYIDLGMFVHHIDVYKNLGGFDENMTRLVDWDLIVRYTEKYRPIYINETCLLYNDTDNRDRISNTEDLDKNMAYFRQKHGDYKI